MWIYKQNKNKRNLLYLNKHYRPILQYDLEGNFIKKWESCTKASKALNIYVGGIYKCCKKKQKHAGRFVWRHENN